MLWGKNDVLAYWNSVCKTAEELRERASLSLEIVQNIKGMNFSDTISYLLIKFDLTIREITDVSEDKESLGYRLFVRYKNDEVKNLNKRIVIAICISMGLPFFISAILMENAGFAFTNTFEDSLLRIILENNAGDTFETINRMLISNGIEPLTEKK